MCIRDSAYIGYEDILGSVVVKFDYDNMIDITLYESGELLEELVVTGLGIKKTKKALGYASSTITSDKSNSGQTISSKEVRKLPTKNISAIASTTAALSQVDEGDNITVRGSRAEVTDLYIDGIRIRGALIPEKDILNKNEKFAEDDIEIMEEEIAEIPEAKARQRKKALKKPQPSRDWVNQNQTVTAYRQWGFHQPEAFYAPAYEQKEQPIPADQRTDFRKTLYWNPEVETGMDGTAKVSFYTSDALTSFRATLEGFGPVSYTHLTLPTKA